MSINIFAYSKICLSWKFSDLDKRWISIYLFLKQGFDPFFLSFYFFWFIFLPIIFRIHLYSVIIYSVKWIAASCHFTPICFHVVVQLLSHVQLFASPWTTACQAPLSSTVSRSFHKLIHICHHTHLQKYVYNLSHNKMPLSPLKCFKLNLFWYSIRPNP